MLLAIAGGYALAAVAAAAISVGAPAAGLMPRADAVMFGTMFAFVVHAVAAIWVFSCHSPWKALAGIVVPLAVIGVALAATLPGAST
ncbi:MAG: iron transporter [Lautropia sp.]